jgi:hypothetical protein
MIALQFHVSWQYWSEMERWGSPLTVAFTLYSEFGAMSIVLHIAAGFANR